MEQETRYVNLMEQPGGEREVTTYILELPRGVRTPETIRSGGLILTKVVQEGGTKECSSTHSGEH